MAFSLFRNLNEVLWLFCGGSYSARHHATAQLLFFLPYSLYSKENSFSLTASAPSRTNSSPEISGHESEAKSSFPLAGN